MQPCLAVPLITLVVGVPVFVLGQLRWPPAPASPTPSEAQLLLFVVLFLVEALLVGLGVAFLAFGFSVVQQAAGRVGVNLWLVYLALAWPLVAWWPHDNFHGATGMDLGALVLIEDGFHLTLILATLVVARFVLATLRAAGAAPAAARDAALAARALRARQEG